MSDIKRIKRIAILSSDYFEESELTSPLEYLQDKGYEVEVIAPHEGEIKGLKHVNPGESVTVDKTLDQANANEYDALVLPGGAINADTLRTNQKAQRFTKQFMDDHKPIAAICHAPWLLASSRLIDDKELTSFPSIQDDVRNAGGDWVDREVVIDDNLITSRKPDDLPAFNAALSHALAANT